MIVAVTAPRRYVDVNSFIDITTKECLGTGWDADGRMTVQFAANLTADEVTRVRIRCFTADNSTEALMRQAWTALQANLAYLAQPGVDPQVVALTKQVNALIRLQVPVEV